MNAKKLIKTYLQSSYAELLNFAFLRYKMFVEHIRNNYDVDPMTLFSGIFFTVAATDGHFSNKEYEFIKAFSKDMTYELAIENAKDFYARKEDSKESTIMVLNSLPNNIKEAVIELCIIIMCVDGNVSYNESELLKNINQTLNS